MKKACGEPSLYDLLRLDSLFAGPWLATMDGATLWRQLWGDVAQALTLLLELARPHSRDCITFNRLLFS